MNKTQKKDLFIILLSTLLLITGLLIKNPYILCLALITAGYKVVIEAIYGIVKGQFLDENFLMTVAVAGALYCRELHEAVGIMLFYKIGEFFEHYAVNNSRKSISSLMEIVPQEATRLVNGKEEIIDPEEIEVGDILLVRAGEKIPVDATVVDGFSSINTAALTGESVPLDVKPNSKVISGTLNLSGVLKIKATSIFEDSTVSKVLDMVENATSRKAKVENFITKFAKYYTPWVVSLALLVAIVPPLFLNGSLERWIYVAAKFLVISCPCALVISVPLSLFAGIGSASKQGVLIKGSNFLESLSNAKIVAFDKTGTLTKGEFSVTKVLPSRETSRKDLLLAAYLGEEMSNHPIAKAICKYCIEEKIAEKISGNEGTYEEIAGKGTVYNLDGIKIYCGNKSLMEDLNIEVEEPKELGSVVYVGENNRFLGAIVVSDSIKENSKDAISKLYKLGIEKTAMVTGDVGEIATSIGKKLGITKVFYQLLPSDKVKVVEELMQEEHRGSVIYIGDGINDAPVLARADVGIAMGALGSDAAIESADVVLMDDDLTKVATIIKISKKTLRICKENIVFALGVKALVLILAPFGLVTMWEAVFADVGVAILAILNAMRALKFK